MDKNNKYYDIIENLVKNHKKFAGLETILDDIMDDVYSHSEIIISSIKDENVIKSYLEKIVSTSLVTVPKKLNFNKNARHAVIGKNDEPKYDNLIQETSMQNVNIEYDTSFAEKENDKEEELKVNPEYVDKMINSLESTEIDSSENVLREIDLDKNLINITEDNNQEDIETIDLETFDADTNAETQQLDDEDFNDEMETEEAVICADEFVEDDEKAEIITDEVILQNENPEEKISDNIDNSIEEQNQNDILSAYEEIDFPEKDEDEQEYILEENETVELPEPEESNSEEDSDLNPLEDISEDSLDEDNLVMFESESDLTSSVDFADTSEEDNLLKLEDDNSSEFSTDENEAYSFSLSEENQVVEDLTELSEYSSEYELEENNTEMLSEEKDSKNNDFIPSDFSCLYYEPKDILKDVNSEEVISQIYNLNDSSPELHVLSVYNLKYKQNMPISKIAEELSIDESKVVEALNKIIDLV